MRACLLHSVDYRACVVDSLRWRALSFTSISSMPPARILGKARPVCVLIRTLVLKGYLSRKCRAASTFALQVMSFPILSKQLENYIKTLQITQGERAGELFQVLPWQRRFIRGAFAPGVETSSLTIGRGGGKSSLASAICCAAIDGCLRQPRAETILVASSMNQARILFDGVKAMLGDKLEDRKTWRVLNGNAAVMIEHKPSGARVRAISSDARRAHGLQAGLTIIDEPARHEENSAESLLVALTTGTGKIPDARIIAIGTRPKDSEHWFSKWLNGGADYSQIHAAPDDAPIFQKATWRRANPSLDHLPVLEAAIRKHAGRARRDTTELQSFKGLRLNQGVAETLEAMLIDGATWQAAEELTGKRTGRLCVGLDLGSGSAMSCAAAYFVEGKALEVFATFPELPSLAERGLNDGVGDLYVKMAARGELIQRGRRVADIGGLLREVLARWGIPDIFLCDDWRKKELLDALDAINFPHSTRLITRRMGYQDGGEDLRTFVRAVIDQKVCAPESLLMRSAIAGARITSDQSGNSKLAKRSEHGRRSTHRDDAVAAALLAVSYGIRNPETRKVRYLGMIPV